MPATNEELYHLRDAVILLLEECGKTHEVEIQDGRVLATFEDALWVADYAMDTRSVVLKRIQLLDK